MNLLIGLVIVTCLVLSECGTPEPTTHLELRLGLIGLISFLVPGLAFFQTVLITRRLENTNLSTERINARLNALSICHSAVWLCASVAIIWAVRWQDIVRETWDLDRFPLADECLILAPILFSLVASWAIFYDIQRSLNESVPRPGLVERLRKRFQFVSIRAQVYVLLILIPLSFAVLARDLAPWFESLNQLNQNLAVGVGCVLIAIFFPFVMLAIWSNRKLAPSELRDELNEICLQHKLKVWDIRVWNTGHQLINAVVVGFVPYFRMILFSDRMVASFPPNEIKAVLRHEAAHVRLWHLPIRVFISIVPLIALAIDEQVQGGILTSAKSYCMSLGVHPDLPAVIASGLALGFVLFSLSWMSRKMEFEADIYSCFELKNKQWVYSRELANDMRDALLRLAHINPEQLNRKSFFHPSLSERIHLLEHSQDDAERLTGIQNGIARQRMMLLICTVCAAGLFTLYSAT